MDTAVHLLKPTFSFKKKGDIAVTQIGATNARVKALGNEISDIAKKNKYVENTKIKPLINWSIGFLLQTNDFLSKRSIIESAKTTVKKYLAQVICKTSIEELKYFAIASINGTIIQADALRITAFMRKSYLLIKVF